jgi:hypothetical protein
MKNNFLTNEAKTDPKIKNIFIPKYDKIAVFNNITDFFS